MTIKDIEVRISRRTLWVDMQAYPLSNVTRVQPLEIVPRRTRILVAYGREAGAWVGLGAAGFVLIGCLGNAVPPVVTILYGLVVLGALAWITTQLVRRLSRPNLYVLSIATSGSPHAAVASRNRDMIWDLARRVVDAIDDPAMEYAIHIEHVEIKGDLVSGNKHGGDTVSGDKIVFGD